MSIQLAKIAEGIFQEGIFQVAFTILCSRNQWKNIFQQIFYKLFEKHFWVKMFLTLIAFNLFTDWLLSLFGFLYEPKTRTKFLGSCYSGNKKYFCFFVFLFVSTSKIFQIQKIITEDFSYMLFLLVCDFLPKPKKTNLKFLFWQQR